MLDGAVVSQASSRIAQFVIEWRDEVPLKLHGHGLDKGGFPNWTGEFAGWLQRDGRRRPIEDGPDRYRLVRAMRQLRKLAPREHDVIWRVFAGESAEQVCAWLNQRAISGGHPERFSLKDTVVLIVSGVDKLAYWY